MFISHVLCAGKPSHFVMKPLSQKIIRARINFQRSLEIGLKKSLEKCEAFQRIRLKREMRNEDRTLEPQNISGMDLSTTSQAVQEEPLDLSRPQLLPEENLTSPGADQVSSVRVSVIRQARREPEEPEPQEQPPLTDQIRAGDQKTYLKCEECQTWYSTIRGFVEHQTRYCPRKIKRKHPCTYCEKVFTARSSLYDHVRIHTGTLFKCKFCDKEFQRRQAMEIHERSHTKERPFVCDVCGMRFTGQPYLRKHMQTHLLIQKYKCGDCMQSFPRKCSLIIHQRNTNHKNLVFDGNDVINLQPGPSRVRKKKITAFECQVCRKGFTRRWAVTRHHREGKCPGPPVVDRHECPVCHQCFTKNWTLMKHIEEDCPGPNGGHSEAPHTSSLHEDEVEQLVGGEEGRHEGNNQASQTASHYHHEDQMVRLFGGYSNETYFEVLRPNSF